MYIVVNPQDETVIVTDFQNDDEISHILEDGAVDTLPFGRLVAVFGKSSRLRTDWNFVCLPSGQGFTEPLRGPVVLTAQAGYYLDETIASHLAEDLRSLAAFYRPVLASDGQQWLLQRTDGSEVITHPVLEGCQFTV